MTTHTIIPHHYRSLPYRGWLASMVEADIRQRPDTSRVPVAPLHADELPSRSSPPLKPARPIGESLTAVPSDIGITNPNTHWRKPLKPLHGSIHAIPTIAGEVVATDGILAAVRDATGHVHIAHLKSFKKTTTETAHGSRSGRRKPSILDDYK